jgi:general secretion pathway protein J
MSRASDILSRRGAKTGSQAGFTLIEVLLAISIMAAITGVMWVSIGAMFQTRDYMGARFERYQIMRVAMNRISRELASAYVAGPANGGEPLPGKEAEAMEQRAENGSLQQRIEPVQFGMIGKDDGINFTTFAHIRTLAGEDSSQHAEIGYFVESRRNEDGEIVDALMRREDTTIDDDITDGGHIFMMIPNVEEVEFEYWDPGPVKLGTMKEMAEEGQWVDAWDTTREEFAGRLPPRMRIRVTLPPMNERSREETFTIQTEIATTEVLEF